MRLFQQQVVQNPFDNPNHAPPPPPPFLTDQEEEKRMSLLRESTTHLREGRQRLPTPDRCAIMELSSSFEKRRLGKQQQILSEITLRCREQEVTDLSSKISAKVDLKKTDGAQAETSPFSTHTPHRKSKGQLSGGSLSTGDLRELEAMEKRLKFEKAYKFFPARKIMRQPSRLSLVQTTTSRPGGISGDSIAGGGGGGGGIVGGTAGGSTSYRDITTTGTSYRDSTTAGTTTTGATRINIDFLKGMRSTDPESRAQILERQNINGSIQLQHYIQPKLDAMAPLLLPEVHSMDGGYQDRIDNYFSSSRLALNQRSKTYYESGSVSGRSYRNLRTAGSGVGVGGSSGGGMSSGRVLMGSRHFLKSMKSDRGVSYMPLREVEDPAAASGDTVSREVPIDLKSSAASGIRSESQKV